MVLNTASGGNLNGPQLDDLLALHRKYGDFFEKGAGNDTPATATPLGFVHSNQVAQAGSDIDDHSDVDVFSFHITALAELAEATNSPERIWI